MISLNYDFAEVNESTITKQGDILISSIVMSLQRITLVLENTLFHYPCTELFNL